MFDSRKLPKYRWKERVPLTSASTSACIASKLPHSEYSHLLPDCTRTCWLIRNGSPIYMLQTSYLWPLTPRARSFLPTSWIASSEMATFEPPKTSKLLYLKLLRPWHREAQPSRRQLSDRRGYVAWHFAAYTWVRSGTLARVRCCNLISRYAPESALFTPRLRTLQYFESAAARELFEFQDTESEVSKQYVKALANVLHHKVRFAYTSRSS